LSQLILSEPPASRVRPTFPRKPGKRSFVGELFSSPVSLKWIMALTGVAGMGFVFAHMVGNLHLYEGPEEVNAYAEALRTLGGHLAPRGGVLWLMRFGLLTAIAIHIYAAYRLTVVNHKARPEKYATKRDYIAADYASRTMRITGIWLGAFIVYHLADLTGGKALSSDDFIHGDPYNNVVESFSNPLVATFYILSMGTLAFHLYHGAWSIFQSLGINSPRYNSWRRGFALGFATIVLIGNISFPVMVQLGVISQDTRCWPSAEQIHTYESLLSDTQSLNEEVLREQIDAGEVCPFESMPRDGDIGDLDLVPVLDDTAPAVLPEQEAPLVEPLEDQPGVDILDDPTAVDEPAGSTGSTGTEVTE
jgi:succinate dehydrogenase / fumarate reductase cytochrome b subunit